MQNNRSGERWQPGNDDRWAGRVNNWQRWVQAPQTLGFRRFLFQVHLWLGIGFGLYILAISVSGSAVVLRPQLNRWFVPSQVASSEGKPLEGAALEQRISQIYSGYTVTNIVPSTRPGRAIYVALSRNGEDSSRFFDQYAGNDLGNSYPWQVQTVEWLTRFHDDLLLDRRTGRMINGIGGMLFLVMTFSGMVLWWQGRRRWKDGLQLKRDSSHSLMFQLHSFLGFWTLLLMLAWGLTAIYFAFPQPFDFIIDVLDQDLDDFDRPDKWLLFLIDLHFGRFRGSWLAYVWVFLGLLPAFMFISGFVMWYRRVLRRIL